MTNYVAIVNKEITPETQKKIESNIPADVQQKQIPPRIYIHIVREDQRAHAATVGKQLEENGFIVPGIEKVTFPSSSLLKCFESGSFTGSDTTKILNILRNISKVQMRSNKSSGSSKIRPRHYEIWFGENFPSNP